MKKIYLSLIILLIFLSSITLGQSVDIGLRIESFAYSINYTQKNTNSVKFIPVPLSGYFKAGVLFYDKYEVEIKTGVQLLDPFTGPEYAILFKYNILKNIFPLVAYLNHFNEGDSRILHGTYGDRMDFVGIGVEAKLIKLFSLDLLFYYPLGKKDLEYEGSIDEKITTAQMGPMIKLGFIFNIIRF